MTTCRDIEPLITAYVDGEGPLPDRTAVTAHLEACAACRDRVAAEDAARQMLRVRAASLLERAPLDLRARCAAGLCPPVARTSPRWWIARLSMAAVLVLALIGVAAYGLFGRTSTVLAAQLALDHLKCFSFYEGSSGPSDPAVLEARLQEQYGWRVSVPPTSPDGRLQLVGARRCIIGHGRIAHILYRHDGRPLSLFVLPSTERPAGHVEALGYEVRVWSRGGNTYALVASEPDAEVDRAAAYLKGATD